VVGGVAAGVLLMGGCEPDRGAETGSGGTAAPSEAGHAVAAPSAEPTPQASAATDPGTSTVHVVEDGRGPETIPLDLPATELFIATVTYQAAGEHDPFNFSVTGTNGQQQYSYSGVGDHSGTHPLGFEPSFIGPPASLEIDGTGNWTVDIQSLSAAPAWPQVTEGDGSMVMRVEPGTLDGATEVTAEHDGYFGVDSYAYAGNPSGEDFLLPEQLVVDFDAGTSRFTLPEDTFVVKISADSPWTLDMP
jgi:hypothetical protein